jgi:hypothetical protein
MSITKLIRWSGLSLMLGGIAFAVHLITHPPGETAQYAFYPLWVPSHLLGSIASVLILLGLVGLYARQSEKIGLPGLIGFILTFVGFTLSAGALIFLSVILVPFLAVRGLDWMDVPNGALYTSPALQLTVGLSALSLLLGLLLFAITTLRARVLPRWGAWLIILTIPLGIVGGVFIFFIGTSLQGILQTLLGVLLGLGLAAWGWALWSEKGETVAQVQSAK